MAAASSTHKAGIWSLFSETARQWQQDNIAVLGAAMAYYVLFSLFPLLLVLLSLVGFIVGNEDSIIRQSLRVIAGGAITPETVEQIDVNTQVFNFLRDTLTDEAALQIETILNRLHEQRRGASVIGFLILFVIGSSVFAGLNYNFQIIWGQTGKPPPMPGILGPLLIFVRRRLLSFVLVLCCVLLLLISMLVSVAITLLNTYTTTLPISGALWQMAHFFISFGILTVVLMLLFKFLPEVRITWGDVWLGALLTASVFTLLTRVSSYIIARSDYQAYGAVGSIMALLLWVFLSSQVLFLGAEFTHVYAHMYGSHRPQPSEHAMALAQAVHRRLALQILTRSGEQRIIVGTTDTRENSGQWRPLPDRLATRLSSRKWQRRLVAAGILGIISAVSFGGGLLRAVRQLGKQPFSRRIL